MSVPKYDIMPRIATNNHMGYTALNLLSSLSVCSACTPIRPLVPLPIKSSPSKRKNPKGIIAALTQKNSTSM